MTYDRATVNGGANAINVSATPAFSGLVSPSIDYGTSMITLSGHLAAGTQSPPAGENVFITLNGATQTATLDSSGNFSSAFSTATLGVAGSPYTVAYNYDGDSNFLGASGSSTLTVIPKALTVTADSTSKTYGQTVTFAGTEFTTSGLVNGDTVATVTLNLSLIHI